MLLEHTHSLRVEVKTSTQAPSSIDDAIPSDKIAEMQLPACDSSLKVRRSFLVLFCSVLVGVRREICSTLGAYDSFLIDVLKCQPI